MITVFTGAGEIVLIAMSACLDGFIHSWLIVLPIAIVRMIETLFTTKSVVTKKAQ